MEYNKVEEQLFYLEEFNSKGNEKIDWDDLRDFERSYKYNFKLRKIKARLKYLYEWRLNIGKEVYTSRDKWNYTLVDGFSELDTLNRNSFDNSYSTIFTKEMFDNLCLDYINYSIEYLLKDFLERNIVSNSTHQLGNLVYSWELECKQELLNDFKNIVNR